MKFIHLTENNDEKTRVSVNAELIVSISSPSPNHTVVTFAGGEQRLCVTESHGEILEMLSDDA